MLVTFLKSSTQIITPFQLYLFMNGLIFETLSGCSSIYHHNFLDLLLLFSFLSNLENEYVKHNI